MSVSFTVGCCVYLLLCLIALLVATVSVATTVCQLAAASVDCGEGEISKPSISLRVNFMLCVLI